MPSAFAVCVCLSLPGPFPYLAPWSKRGSTLWWPSAKLSTCMDPFNELVFGSAQKPHLLQCQTPCLFSQRSNSALWSVARFRSRTERIRSDSRTLIQTNGWGCTLEGKERLNITHAIIGRPNCGSHAIFVCVCVGRNLGWERCAVLGQKAAVHFFLSVLYVEGVFFLFFRPLSTSSQYGVWYQSSSR